MIHSLRYILSLLFVSIVLLTQAQKSTKISGKLIDESTQSVPYVSVSLHLVKDGSVSQTIQADSLGNFLFNNPSFGYYYIRVKSITHQELFSQHFRLDERNMDYDLGRITLLQNNAYLAEVTVHRKKNLIEQQQDKIVFNIENSMLADGNNGLELLNKIPGVSVQESGDISIKGKAGTSIMINGKLTYLSADQLANLLRSTSSTDINKIEVMANPNAKHDAAGTSGIINIVLKKGLKQGFNGTLSANAGAGRGAHLGGGLNLNYRTEKINVFAIYNQYFQNLEYSNSLTRYFYSNPQAQPDTYSQQENLIQPKLRSNNFRAGIDINLSPKQTLGFLIHGGFGKYPKYEPTSNHFRKYQSQDLIWAASTITEGRERWEDMLYNINYNIKFNEDGHELKMDLDFVNHYSKMDQQLNTNYTDALNNSIRPLSSRIGDIPSDNQVLVGKIDYSLPLANRLKFEAGWKGSQVRTENDLHYDTLQHGQYIPDLSTSNHFIYKEMIQAGYINLSKTWEKLSAQLGLRGEYTRTEGNQITTDHKFEKNYFHLFPSAFLTYALTDNHKLQASYSHRVQRPSFWDLNPFRVYTDPFSYSEGNAELNPSYEHAFEFSYTLASKYILTLNYSTRDDVVNEILGRDSKDSHITFEKPLNLGSFKNYGASLIVPLELTSFWNSTNFINYYRNEYSLPLDDDLINRAGNTLTLNSQNTFKLPKDWSLELGGNYVSGLTIGLTDIKSYGIVYSGIQKTLFNKKATIKLVVNDIFRTNNRRYETNTNTIRLLGIHRPDSRTALLSLTYRFGGSEPNTKNRATGSEEIKSRL